ncbi:hypothetical protein K466DRAFT_448354, partial [Polyporus arcularius HHB13444]
LESVHQGEFSTGTMEAVSTVVDKLKANPLHVPSTETLPKPPPLKCDHTYSANCNACQEYKLWKEGYIREVDKILYLSNVHKCNTRSKFTKAPKGAQNTGMQESDSRGCTDPVTGVCKACFPRQTFAFTQVDPETGALMMKSGEPWMNTFTPAMSYLMRCNHDVTSLLSGTAIKSVIAYIADYITKTPLKTHVM